jgi:hypothetical protein
MEQGNSLTDGLVLSKRGIACKRLDRARRLHFQSCTSILDI